MLESRSISLARKFILGATTAAVLVPGAAACTNGESGGNSSFTYNASLITTSEFNALPNGPCRTVLSQDAKQRIVVDPLECKEAQISGRLAVVDFLGLSEAERDEFIKLTENYLTVASSGVLKTKLTVVDPSVETVEIFKEKTQESKCVDPSTPEGYSSALADVSMPDLQSEYDFVVSLNSISSCGNVFDGRAEDKNQRHVDVFPGNKDKSMRYYAATTAHEFLHLLNLGHAGKALKGELDMNFISGTTIDCSNSILYDDLGDKINLMGVFYDSEYLTPKLNPIQLDILRNNTNDHYRDAVIISKNQSSVDYSDGNTQRYAVIQLDLDHGLSVYSPKMHTGTTLFSLAIVPNRDSNSKINGFELYIVDPKEGKTIDIGRLVTNSQGNNSWTLTNADQEIQIQFHNNTLSVRTLTN